MLGKKATGPQAVKPDTAGPLGPTFGPIQRLMAVGEGAGGDMSLQRFLDRATALRLRLQQVSHSPDADAQARQMAQALFQGKGSELADTQAYAQLIAASLGAEWAGWGRRCSCAHRPGHPDRAPAGAGQPERRLARQHRHGMGPRLRRPLPVRRYRQRRLAAGTGPLPAPAGRADPRLSHRSARPACSNCRAMRGSRAASGGQRAGVRSGLPCGDQPARSASARGCSRKASPATSSR